MLIWCNLWSIFIATSAQMNGTMLAWLNFTIINLIFNLMILKFVKKLSVFLVLF